MTNGDERLKLVGAGVRDTLARAAANYERLFERLGPNGADFLTALAAAAESTRIELEDCLRGFDSFDTLAFLRIAAGPWDFSDVRESESRIEASQAAQDAIALTLLGMGLPRLPLTGENSGQPEPGRATRLAADIVVAVEARALFEGSQSGRPLGVLAGEFRAYESSVRGRQYQSIATELNTGLLADPRVAETLDAALGFTLADVRSVRTAAIDLLNKRFFGARDRVGDIVTSGRSPDEADNEMVRRDLNLMVSECRLFGAVTAPDVAQRAGLTEARARAVLTFFSIGRPVAGSTNPVVRFAEGGLPAPWGCIADGGEYLLLNGFLAEDELRRDIERGLLAVQQQTRSDKLWNSYLRRRTSVSEAGAAAAIGALLDGAVPRWAGQKYLGPVDASDAAVLGQDAERATADIKEFESDLLLIVDNVALCVEVKAGSFTDKARGGNAQRLATDLEKTLKDGNQQARRLARLIRTNRGVWTRDGTWIELSDALEVHSIIVMLDDMGPLSLSMNHLAAHGIVEADEVPWVVSLHDLIVISRTIEHPAQFVEYLRRRRGPKLATMVSGVDELDLFMWFLNGGLYFEPDPREDAAQIPIDRPIKAADQHRYDAQARVRVGTLTDPLDAWFYRQEGLSDAEAPKPVRREQPWVEHYLTTSKSARTDGWLRFGADLVALSDRAQRKIGKGLNRQRQQARKGPVERSLTTHGTGPYGSWLLTMSVVPAGAETDHLPKYVGAKQYQTASSRSMLLLYDTDGVLQGSRYRGEPQRRTAERDAAIDAAPLLSLADTLAVAPGYTRRSTRQLRGKRSKRKPRR